MITLFYQVDIQVGTSCSLSSTTVPASLCSLKMMCDTFHLPSPFISLLLLSELHCYGIYVFLMNISSFRTLSALSMKGGCASLKTIFSVPVRRLLPQLLGKDWLRNPQCHERRRTLLQTRAQVTGHLTCLQPFQKL